MKIIIIWPRWTMKMIPNPTQSIQFITSHYHTTPSSFGAQVSLILDIAIMSYCTTRFSFPPLYFNTQVKPRMETSQGAPPPHQTVGNVGNVNPSRLAFSGSWKGGYGKISAVDPRVANTRLFLPSFFVLLFPTRMPLTFSRNDNPWQGPPAHGTGASALLALMPTQAHYQDTKYTRLWGFRDGVDHTDSGARVFWCNYSNHNKDKVGGPIT